MTGSNAVHASVTEIKTTKGTGTGIWVLTIDDRRIAIPPRSWSRTDLVILCTVIPEPFRLLQMFMVFYIILKFVRFSTFNDTKNYPDGAYLRILPQWPFPMPS